MFTTLKALKSQSSVIKRILPFVNSFTEFVYSKQAEF